MLPTGALAGAALDATTKAVAELAKAFGGLSTALREMTRVVGEFTPLLTKLGDLFVRLGSQIKSVLAPVFGLLADAVRPVTDRLGAAGLAVTAFVGVVAAKFTKLGAAVADWLKPFTDAIKNVFGKLTDTEAIWKPLTRGLTGLATAAGAAVAALGVVAGGLVLVGNIANNFVAKANPVVAQQFTLAVDDLMAVIGQALVPVMRIVTDLVRAAADTFASFSKDIGGVAGDLLAPIAQMLKEVFSVVGLIGNALASVLKTIGPIVTALLQLIADAVSSVMRFVESILELFGISPGRREGAATGAAVRSASTTDVESVLRKARESAYSLGTASREDPARATVDILGAIRGKMNDLVEVVKGLPERIATAFAGGAVDFAEGVVDTLGDVKNAILDFGRSGLEAAGLRDRPGGGAGVLGPALAAAEAFRDRAGAGSGVVLEAF